MASCVRVFSVDRGGESFDCTDKQLTVLFCGSLQVANEALDLIGHYVEGVTEIAEFCAPGDLDALREIAGCDAMSTAGQFSHRMSQLVSEENPDQNRKQRRDQAYPKRLPAHVGNRSQRCRFVLNRDHAKS